MPDYNQEVSKNHSLDEWYKYLSVTRLTISGGGAKGTVLTGAYRATVDLGVYHKLREISGTSAGALTAGMMSFGVLPQKIRDSLSNLSIHKFLGRRVGSVLLWNNKPGTTFFTHEGTPLYHFLIENFIESANVSLDKIENLNEACQSDAELFEVVHKIRAQKEPITFLDLHILHQHFPEQFKDLTVTAVEIPSGEVQIFNARNTPHIEIAKACWASAALPFLFAPVTIEIDGVSKTFVDGGVFNNTPTEEFDYENGSYTNNKPEQTMVWAFGEGANHEKNGLFQALYGASAITDALKKGQLPPVKFYISWIEAEIGNFLIKNMLGIDHYNHQEEKEKIYKKLRKKYTLRTTILRTSDITTGDFHDAKRNSRTLDALGYMDQFQFYVNHDLHDWTDTEVDDFYANFVKNFIFILNALNKGSNREIDACHLSQEIQQTREQLTDFYHSLEPDQIPSDYKLEAIINREIVYRIIHTVETHLSCMASFAFGRTVDYLTNQIDSKTLFKEIYEEAFRRTSGYQASNIAGQSVFDTATLKKALSQQDNMIQLYVHQHEKNNAVSSRGAKIIDELCHLDKFNNAYAFEKERYDSGETASTLPTHYNDYNVKLMLLTISSGCTAISTAALVVTALSVCAIVTSTVAIPALAVCTGTALLSHGFYKAANYIRDSKHQSNNELMSESSQSAPSPAPSC